MNETQTNLLVSVLASTDALWLPCRDPRSNAWVNTHLARTSYRAGLGGCWRPLQGATEQQRKQRQRALDAMSADGLLVLARRRESRLVGATLTPVGEAMARALCGLPGSEAAVASEDELRRLGDSEFAAVEGRWISERGLARQNYGDDTSEFVLVENMLLPSLVAGRVESLSDSLGRCWYMLTDDGTPNVPPEPTDVEPWCDDLRSLYEQELSRHLDHFAQAKPQTRHEIGPIPLRCSLATKEAA